MTPILKPLGHGSSLAPLKTSFDPWLLTGPGPYVSKLVSHLMPYWHLFNEVVKGGTLRRFKGGQGGHQVSKVVLGVHKQIPLAIRFLNWCHT